MKCERCGIATEGYDLHDYCVLCLKNLCDKCMREGTCIEASNSDREGNTGHEPSATMTCGICKQLVDYCTCDEGYGASE